MLYEGIIITGTSGSGKSTIAKQLQNEKDSVFKVVQAITTRQMREDDYNYYYCNLSEFKKIEDENGFLVTTSYREEFYGIKNESYLEILTSVEKRRIPILVLTPSSAIQLLEKKQLMCFFIDAPNNVLIDRLSKRDKTSGRLDEEQLERDRRDSKKADYILKNNNLTSSISLIKWLWDNNNHGGGLPQKIIKQMLECGMLLEQYTDTSIKGASYDLLLGEEYYYGGRIKKFTNSNPFITIEPYDYAIVSCKEIACIPRDITAKFGVSIGLFCQGIILSNGPQVDPGFHGTLFCLLFNTSNRAIHLKRGQHYATIEFNKLIEPTSPYTGKYQDKVNIIDYIPTNALQGAINELKKEIENLKKESHLMQNVYLVVVGLMFALLSIILILR
jgi:guanylate kinase/deoxycytidine triphosphate deaminase